MTRHTMNEMTTIVNTVSKSEINAMETSSGQNPGQQEDVL